MPPEVAGVLGRGRRGSTALRRVLDAHLPDRARTRSVLEERFLVLCERADLPLPEVNARVCGLTVALWRREGVVVELDGDDAHALRAPNERDRHRELKLRTAGHRVLRYTWQQVTQQPEAVAADLRRALAVSGAAGQTA